METLHTLIARQGALPASEAVGWVIRLLINISGMHARGEIHGRLSAKAVRVADQCCTSQGMLMRAEYLPKSPQFWSPERFDRPDEPQPEDDTWAVGVLLYNVLSSQLPFPGRNARATVERMRAGPAEPLPLLATPLRQLPEILGRVLSLEPGARLTSAARLLDELVAWHPAARRFDPLAEEEVLPEEEEDDATLVYRRKEVTTSALRRQLEAAAKQLKTQKLRPVARPDRAGQDNMPADRRAPAKRTRGKPRLARARMIAAVLVALAVGIIGLTVLVVLFSLSDGAQNPKPKPAPTAGTVSATVSSGPPTVSEAAASGSTTASAVPHGDVTSCLASLLPADAFRRKQTELGSVCQLKSPHQVALRIKGALAISGGSGVTQAQREWAQLGWYELAAAAVMQAHCCRPPPPLEGPNLPAITKCSFDEKVVKLRQVALEGQDMAAAMRDYEAAANCVAGVGASGAFGQRPALVSGGEGSYFRKIVSRLSK